MGKTNFAELETKLGWNYVPESVIFQPNGMRLCDPTQCVVFDWMHVFFVSGIFNTHAGLMMWTLKEYGITYGMLETYLAQWHWPAYIGKGDCEVFDPKRAKSNWDAGTLKATASEGLSVLPIMANFFQSLLDNPGTAQAVKDHSRCFLMLADAPGTQSTPTSCNSRFPHIVRHSKCYSTKKI